MYIHQKKEWPNFVWDEVKMNTLASEVRYSQGQLIGQMSVLGFEVREKANLEVLTKDVIKTSEIEGEKLNKDQVRSSIAKKMGIDIGMVLPPHRHVEGVVSMMLDAIQNFADPLTSERLFSWHEMLFPSGRSGLSLITSGYWRTEMSGPMQVVSGFSGRERIHFEAPSFERIENEMKLFLWWFNANAKIDLIIKSAIAHFWFVTIHPFEDGNGRIARAIGDMVLAFSEQSKQRFYSMSAQIQRDRKNYYAILEKSQKGSLDITEWIEWYLLCMKRAISSSEELLQDILIKVNFWNHHDSHPFNERQRFIINRILDNLFEGKLTSSKWAKMTKCSHDTALRDITNLIQRDILVKEEAGGRNTSYHLKPYATIPDRGKQVFF